MTDKLTPEEVSTLSGGDIENIRDAEHPQRGMDEDTEGTGVDAPDILGAAWDNEIEKEDEDEDNIHWKDIRMNELEPGDREFYLRMASLRKIIREPEEKDEVFWMEVETFLNEFEEMRATSQDNRSRIEFYGMLGSKVSELSYALHKHKQKRAKITPNYENKIGTT